jgi:hypothetical protein
LYTLNDLLYITTHTNEIDIVFIFVQIVAKDLLTLLVDHIQVINDNEFLFTVNITGRSAKGFHFIAEIVDTLFFQIINMENIVLRKRGFFG